jgi:hypothetical protein
VVEQAEAQCGDAALIWDSLGYGAENGGRAEGLAGATRGCKPGCVLVTYDALPQDPRLREWKQLGDAVVLPNSWTARQRYYLYVLPGGDGPPLSVKIDARALKYQEMLAKFRNRDMVERRVEINRRVRLSGNSTPPSSYGDTSRRWRGRATFDVHAGRAEDGVRRC